MVLNAPEMLKTLALCTAAAFGLSACLANDAERGLAGAAGYFCRDLRVPGCVE